MWNPWATYYELHSTHPLIAKRLRYLGNQSLAMGQAPYVVFDEVQPESFWDEFLVDLATLALPLMAGVIGVGLFLAQPGYPAAGLGLLGLGMALGVKALRMYPTRVFPAFNVSGLLASVKVSAVRPVPCTVRGKIIGRGVPGLIWSEDFVMQDDTGIIFLDYRQPLAIWQWLFGLLKAGTYQGREVTVTGWYRRSPTPFVEIYRVEVDGSKRTCYAYYAAPGGGRPGAGRGGGNDRVALVWVLKHGQGIRHVTWRAFGFVGTTRGRGRLARGRLGGPGVGGDAHGRDR